MTETPAETPLPPTSQVLDDYDALCQAEGSTRPEPEAFPKRWQDCTEFVECLRARRYVLGEGNRVCSPGLYLYMYELWQDGKRGS